MAVTATRADGARARRALADRAWRGRLLQRVLSRFDERSDLSRLNRAQGEWVAVDRAADRGGCASRFVRGRRRGRRFDPTILPRRRRRLRPLVSSSWSSARPAARRDGARGQPSRSPHRLASAHREWRCRRSRRHLAKGFAAMRALWSMREAWLDLRGGLVDLGGDIAVWGATPRRRPVAARRRRPARAGDKSRNDLD